MRFDGDYGLACTCGDDGAIKVWRVGGGAVICLAAAYKAHPDGARALLLEGSSGVVMSAGDNGMIKAWQMQVGSLTPLTTVSAVHDMTILSLQLDQLAAAAVHADGKEWPPGKGPPVLLSAGVEGVLKAWHMGGDGRIVHEVAASRHGDADAQMVLAFHSESGTVLSAGMDGSVRAWRVRGSEIVPLAVAEEAHGGYIRGLQYDHASGVAVSAGEDGVIRTWLLKGDTLTAQSTEEDAHDQGICALHFDAEQELLVSCGDEGEVRAWRCVGGSLKLLASLRGAHGGGSCRVQVLPKGSCPEPDSVEVGDAAAMSPKKKQKDMSSCPAIISAGSDGALRVWRLGTKKLRKFTAAEGVHVGGVLALHVAYPSGVTISTGVDGAMKAWRIEQGVLNPFAKIPQVHGGKTLALQFDASTRTLMSAGGDKSISTWRLQEGALTLVANATDSSQKVFQACPITGDNRVRTMSMARTPSTRCRS